jgi:hypothetical protein
MGPVSNMAGKPSNENPWRCYNLNINHQWLVFHVFDYRRNDHNQQWSNKKFRQIYGRLSHYKNVSWWRRIDMRWPTPKEFIINPPLRAPPQRVVVQFPTKKHNHNINDNFVDIPSLLVHTILSPPAPQFLFGYTIPTSIACDLSLNILPYLEVAVCICACIRMSPYFMCLKQTGLGSSHQWSIEW